MSAEGRRIAVLDVGKTNVKVVLVDGGSGEEARARTMPNRVRQDGPYPHVDVGRIEAFVLDALADFAREEGGFDAVSITAHGATAALLAGEGLVLPVLDYEHAGPDEFAGEYDDLRPAFAESFSPRLPGGLNLGAQLFWQQRRFPDAFAAALALVTYPQYWSWWLTGVATTESTSLGAHTDLWAPRAGCFSTLVARAGWTALMAPLRSAFDRLGPIKPELARQLGLRDPLPVLCGIHDSNASLLPHIQGEAGARAVVSTGTWVIVFAVGGSLDRLDATRDTLANVDAYGRAVPSARFMGGREFDQLTGGEAVEVRQADVDAAIGRGFMALPSFAPGNGPFPLETGRWSHDPATLDKAERLVAASLYAALMTATCLDLLGATGPTVVEGPFARNRLYCDGVAALTGRPLAASRSGTGTSAGAASLAALAVPEPGRFTPSPPAYHLGESFKSYADRWRQQTGAPVPRSRAPT